MLALQNYDYYFPVEDVFKAYKSLKCKALTFLDYDYPEKLKQMWHPPLVLFYYGDISLLDKHIVATVGSRNYSDYGKQQTENIISNLGKDVVIISGLARGIDTIAHECAINSGARTIAVLGSGIDNCYPPENQKLFDEIKKNHLLISEYPFTATPDAIHFPNRNRIVVGLADAIFIPQINTYQSGTMISLNLANEAGKPVFMVPYPPGSQTINNRIINEGAIVADSASQMLDELGWKLGK